MRGRGYLLYDSAGQCGRGQCLVVPMFCGDSLDCSADLLTVSGFEAAGCARSNGVVSFPVLRAAFTFHFLSCFTISPVPRRAARDNIKKKGCVLGFSCHLRAKGKHARTFRGASI